MTSVEYLASTATDGANRLQESFKRRLSEVDSSVPLLRETAHLLDAKAQRAVHLQICHKARL